MLYVFIFLAELAVLFFSSRLLTKSLSFLPINLISIIFLPGIVIHELSHFIFSSLLFVRAGEIEFTPKVEDRSVKLGSVSIAKTDPVRRFLIGVSPVIFGTLVILATLSYLPGLRATWYFNLLIFYVLFVIGNTMFSSKKDMEGSIVLLIVIVFLSFALYFLGARIPQEFFANVSSKGNLFKQLDYFLAFVIGVDFTLSFLGNKVRG